MNVFFHRTGRLILIIASSATSGVFLLVIVVVALVLLASGKCATACRNHEQSQYNTQQSANHVSFQANNSKGVQNNAYTTEPPNQHMNNSLKKTEMEDLKRDAALDDQHSCYVEDNVIYNM